MANTIRLRFQPDDLDVVVTLDVSRWMGDMLEVVESHLDGEPVLAWARRMGETFSRGFRINELRAKDIIALAYLGVAPGDLAATWQSVARSIAPYTMQIVDAEDAERPAPDSSVTTPVRVSPVVEALAQRRVENATTVGMPDVVVPAEQ